jgi:ABC-type polysaccharide/polyol phosphate transport system ATPase subunit
VLGADPVSNTATPQHRNTAPGGDAAIEARHLCKDFVLGTYHGTLKGLFLRFRRDAKKTVKHALADVNFRIEPGESVALLGRNGSGKSTLLSLIGRIYKPTSGEIRVPAGWRVAPLLELGAGFHHELTGEQNVFLNGVILGLTRKQVEERFAAIVAFAELEDSIDAPIRTYSSGMLMRLGFAIASHTDAEILLVDEILAPADEEFQEKCYRRIREFQQEGRTILFVSHDMDAVRRVAERALWLDAGRLRADGPREEVIEAYHREQRRE